MLKVGMYVRCPVDGEKESLDESRIFFLGQIESIDERSNIITVKFHDPWGLRSFFSSFPGKKEYKGELLSHTTVLDNSIAVFNGSKIKLLCTSKTGDSKEYYQYFVEYYQKGRRQVGELSEKQIEVPFTRANYNPANQMLRYELQNPMWYVKRRIVSQSLSIIENAPFGFKNLLSTRVYLFSHQIDTIIRALSESPCRLMLADEVGLGKTVEALVILKGMLSKRPNLRTLIVVPETLIYQWQTEINLKFWKEAPIWGIDKIEDPYVLLVSFKDITQDIDRIHELCHWDLCIVDETHKLLLDNLLYQTILDVSKSTENILLLSATPILRHKEEYGKLLTLLNSKRFESMPFNELSALLDKQKYIRDVVFSLMRDLPDYVQYDLHDDFTASLREINEVIGDSKLAELIQGIDHFAQDKGLSQIKLTLAYIAEFYQIERGIIRHRRTELTSLAGIKRQLKAVPYSMAGSDVGFYEENCYNAVLECAEQFCSEGDEIDLALKLVAAVSSSPYALMDILQSNKNVLEEYDIDNLNSLVLQWMDATNNEINRINEVSNKKGDFFSKFARIVDFIDKDDIHRNKKYLIFTGFTATAKKLKECFIRYYGKRSTCSFHSEMASEAMQEAVTMFQNETICRFMICDESGGEGRNFQVADYIVHFDLPWSPAMLEQRIGRLDRIGRKFGKDVISVVIHAYNSLEENLLRLYTEGLGIFNQSLCGMEIAFGEIQSTIESALKDDIRIGISNAIPKISEYTKLIGEEIEKERYFDMARQLDIDLQSKLDKLIGHFTENDGKAMMDTMLAWPPMVGFFGVYVQAAFGDGSQVVTIDVNSYSVRSMEQAVYFPPKMDDIVGRSKHFGGLSGTFSREAAVKHENLVFFAPYNVFFDSITGNAEECYRGRCTAMSIPGAKIRWTGLLLTWNLKYNPEKLYREKHSPDLIMLIKRYLPIEQVVFVQSFSQEYENVSAEELIDYLNALGLKKPRHLGKRGNGSMERFKQQFPRQQWNEIIINAYKNGKEYAEEKARVLTELDSARKQLESILTAGRAHEFYYGIQNEGVLLRNDNEIEALMYGLEHLNVELDSIAFINLDQEAS